VLLDTNVLVSYLLAPHGRTGWFADILQQALSRTFTILLPSEMERELVAVVQRKPYLRERIRDHALRQLFDDLALVAQPVSPLDGDIARVVRDERDDYLMAYALAYDVDVLVSGDKDLLALSAQFDRPRIVTVRAFLDELEAARD